MRAHTSGRVTSFVTECAGVRCYILQGTMWAMQCVPSSRKTYPCQNLCRDGHLYYDARIHEHLFLFCIHFSFTTLFVVKLHTYKYSWSNWANNSSLSQHGFLFYAVGGWGLTARVWWTVRPSVRHMIYERIWTIGGTILPRTSKIPRQKLLPAPLRSPRIPHELPWKWSQVAAVRSWQTYSRGG
jgi:hypothetical protein